MKNNASTRIAIALLLAVATALPFTDVSARTTKPKRPEQSSAGQASVIDGDVEGGSLMAGQSVGMVTQEESVADIIATLVQQAEAALRGRG